MPHSTFLSNPPSPRLSTVSTTPSSPPSKHQLLQSQPELSPFKPSLLQTSTTSTSPANSPPCKLIFLTRSPAPGGHARSKSLNFHSPTKGSMLYPSAPPSPSSPSRRQPRDIFPLITARTSSLPLVIPEGRPAQPSFLHTPATPTAPRRRPASPTRMYNSSLTASPRGSSYHLTRAPSPDSAASSSPSTPTSLRSRSPSISSLDTIPDSPDAEAEAEEEAARNLKSLAEEEDSGRRRRSLDFDRVNGASGRWANADKRKRWSICGGEKRGDLDLETIWEEAVATAGVGRERDGEEDEEEED